jgi:predicted DNA binding protein
MTLIAKLRLYGELILFESTFDQAPDAVCPFADFHYIERSNGDRQYVFFWWMDGCPPDQFEEAVRGDPTVTGFKRVGTLADRPLYRIVTKPFDSAQPLVFPLFRENNITTIETRRDTDGLHIQARFPTRVALDAFVDAAEQIAERTELRRLYTEQPQGPDGNHLTERQREALSLAYERGYFEVPKQVTLTELAAELNITPQTLSRHIRIGVQKIIETTAGSIQGEYPPFKTRST